MTLHIWLWKFTTIHSLMVWLMSYACLIKEEEEEGEEDEEQHKQQIF